MQFFFLSFCSADDRNAVRVENHAGRGFVGAGQVVEVLAVGVAAGVAHLLVLLHARHQTFVTDGLHVVLVAVGRLVQGALRDRTDWTSNLNLISLYLLKQDNDDSILTISLL